MPLIRVHKYHCSGIFHCRCAIIVLIVLNAIALKPKMCHCPRIYNASIFLLPSRVTKALCNLKEQKSGIVKGSMHMIEKILTVGSDTLLTTCLSNLSSPIPGRRTISQYFIHYY